MGTHVFSLGVHIEGIGELGGTSADGTLFVSRAAPGYDASWSVDLWSAIPKVPDILDESVDIWGGSDEPYNTSALEIGMVLDDEAKLPKALVPQSWTNETAAVVADNSSTIEVEPTGQITAGERYFCGKETIQFDSIDSTTASTETWNVTRARHLTAERSHFDGQFIYDRPPNLVERPFRVVLNAESETSEVIWTGLIANWGTNGAHTQIECRARAITQSFANQQLNERATAIDLQGEDVEAQDNTSTFDISGLDVDRNWTDGDGAKTHSSFGEDWQWVHLQVDNRAWAVRRYEQQGRAELRANNVIFPEVGKYEDQRYARPILAHNSGGTSIYEQYGVGEDLNNRGDILLNQDHVMLMALAHVTSTGQGTNHVSPYRTDVFGEDWGVGLQTSLIDTDAWIDVIQRYPNDTADSFVWGWDGEAVDVWAKIKAWCRGYNYLIVPNKTGKIQPVKISDLEITDGSQIAGQSAYIVDNDAPIDAKGEDAVVQVSAEYADLPWVEASRESAKSTGRRRRTLLRDAEATFDLTWLSQHSEAKVRRLLEDHQDKRDEHPPTLKATMTREHFDRSGTLQGETPPLGKWVRIRGGPSRGLMGPDGDYVDPSSDQITYTGLVVSRQNSTKEHLVDIQVLLWMWQASVPARLVAPAVVVGTDSSAGSATGSDGTGDWISYEGNPLVAYDGTIGLMMNDDVVVERPDGIGRNVVREVTQIDTSAKRIYINNAFPSGSVEDGHLLRLSDEQDFANTSWNGSSYWTTSTIADRRYSYIVDASGFFTSGEEADTYTGV